MQIPPAKMHIFLALCTRRGTATARRHTEHILTTRGGEKTTTNKQKNIALHVLRHRHTPTHTSLHT